MKNRTFLCSFAFLLMFFASASATNYYVATNDLNAADTNNGTSVSTPFKTIQKAASIAVAGDVVNIRTGLYRETVRPTNSGTANARIVYQPYNGEEVTVTGTEQLSGFTVHQGNIYKTPMASNFFSNTHNLSNQIFVNGEMMPLARWPNNTTFSPSYPAKSSLSTFVSKVPQADGSYTSKFTDVNLPQGVDLVGAEIYVQPNYEAWSWTFSGKVTAINGNQVTLTTRNGSGKDGGGSVYDSKSRYFLYNKLSLLDAAGEWYHDASTNTLYLWCPNNVNPNTVTVEAKKREFAFDLSDRNYITIKDLKVFASTISTDSEAGGNNSGFDANNNIVYPWRGREYIASATGIKLDGVDAKYVSHYTDVEGHFFLQWGLSSGLVISGTNHEVRNCKIQYSSGNGISVNGKGHKIINNIITDVNYMSTDAAGINTAQPGFVYDVEIAYNTIKRTGRSGITPRVLINSESTKFLARIHHNDISEYMIQDWDGGGIYAASDNQGFLRVDHNTFYNAVNAYVNSGVYFDWTKNIIVDHNVIWNNDWPLHFQAYGSGNLNNTLVYNNTTIARNAANKSYGPFNIANSIGTNIGTVIQNNIMVYADGTNISAPGTYRPIDLVSYASAKKESNFLHEMGVPGFVDLQNFDFQLTATSPCVNAGTLFQETVIEGVTVPAFNDPIDGTVDIGAYEFGKPKFLTGANHSPDNQVPTSPQGVKAEKVSSNSMELSWTPSTDNIGITAYHVYEGSTLIGYSEHPFLKVTNLIAANTYNFSVKAVDYRGNFSDPAFLTVSTISVDNEAPSIPQNVRVEDATLTNFKAVWSESTDNNFVEKYEVKLNGVSKGFVSVPSTSLKINGLSANTLYKLLVIAYDGSGNSSISPEVDVTTGNAALVAYEPFNYSVGTLNPDADGTASGFGYPASNFELISTGLRGNWGAKSAVLANSLIYSNALNDKLLTNNNSLALENGTLSRSLYMYSGLTGDPFASYKISTGDFGENNSEIWFSILMNVSDINNDVRLIFKSITNKNHFSIGVNNKQWCIIDSTLNKIGGVQATSSQTVLLLVKTTYGSVGASSRDDKVELWVNPNLTGSLPPADAVYNNMVGNYSRFGTLTSLASTSNSICTLDEMRIGLQKEDVLPLSTLSALKSAVENQRNVYPTVTSNFVNVVDLEGYQFSIFNMEGKLMYSDILRQNNMTINLSAYNKGMYFIKALGKNESKFFKIIVL